MAGESTLTLIGNLVDEPEMRFTPNGAAVCKFRVASTPRKFNRDTNAWEDDREKALFLPCTVWRKQAEQAAESLQKGMRVIVVGRLSQRSYEDREGVKRTVLELEVDEVAPSLKYATAQVTKAGGSGGGQQAYQQARQASSREGMDDPWTSPPPAGGGQQQGGWGGGQGGYSDEAPF
jgi:single-strand DNA-binding protein